MGRATEQRSTPLSANRETQSSLKTPVPSKRAHPSGPQHDEATANCTGSRPGGLASRQETSRQGTSPAELADADRVAQVPDSSSTRRQWHKRHGYDMQMHWERHGWRAGMRQARGGHATTGWRPSLHQAAPVSRRRLVRLVRLGRAIGSRCHAMSQGSRGGGHRSAERGWTQLPISGHSCEHIRFAVGDEACLMSRRRFKV